MSHHPSPQRLVLAQQAPDPPDYEAWTREELIARLKELTGSPNTLQISTSTSTSPSQLLALPLVSSSPSLTPSSPSGSNSKKRLPEGSKLKREFDFSAYPTRKIALKFSYAGVGYGGLAWQAVPTPLPTVEGVLFAALAKARLVDPDGGLEGCGWERCGRTDRGVSAAGQVVSLYVRSSNRRSAAPVKASGATGDALEGAPNDDDTSALTLPERDIRYLHTLNAILPSSIRVYAWAPVASSFSSRFSCRTRHYKYFFSARSLDVDAMRAGAARLVGEHDFRNLCKLDPAKQLTSFRRRVVRADISPVVVGAGGSDMHMHVLDLIGSAFLYNQVRHIMAVLLLIGARLEAPSVISALLNADPDDEDGARAPSVVPPEGEESPPPRVTCKPEYQMADALPLVLWDCTYAAEDVQWRADDAGSDGGSVGLYSQLVGLAERAQVEATLAEHFLAAAAPLHRPAAREAGSMLTRAANGKESGPWDVPLGGGMKRREGNYVPLLNRKRLESVEVVNERWRTRRKGKESTCVT